MTKEQVLSVPKRKVPIREGYTNDELKWMIEDDGLGPTIRDVEPIMIADPNLRDWWEKAQEALDEIEEELES